MMAAICRENVTKTAPGSTLVVARTDTENGKKRNRPDEGAASTIACLLGKDLFGRVGSSGRVSSSSGRVDDGGSGRVNGSSRRVNGLGAGTTTAGSEECDGHDGEKLFHLSCFCLFG